MAGIAVRLHGVDAPELYQTCSRQGQSWACGKEAMAKLGQLVNGAELRCEQRDVDDYDRIVASCTARQIDLGQAMVEAGLAVALPQFSDRYLGAEARAKALKLGIWNSDFQQPADYRAANPRAHRPKPQASAARQILHHRRRPASITAIAMRHGQRVLRRYTAVSRDIGQKWMATVTGWLASHFGGAEHLGWVERPSSKVSGAVLRLWVGQRHDDDRHENRRDGNLAPRRGRILASP